MDAKLAADQDKLAKIEQKKRQLTNRAQALKASVRKKENALKYAHGGLIKKAGLADLSDEQLLGLLVEQQTRRMADPALLTTWEETAKTAFTKAKKQPVIIKFDDKPGDDVTALLKHHKLRWNRYAQHWEGDVSGDALEDLTATLGPNTVTRLDL